jgi:hypothetical protein
MRRRTGFALAAHCPPDVNVPRYFASPEGYTRLVMQVRATAERRGWAASDRASMANGLSLAEREQYVRWWREQSGLSERELSEIATGVWADRLDTPSSGESAWDAEAA